MCKTTQLEHSVCFHKDNYTNICSAGAKKSVFSRFFRCKRTTEVTCLYDLCHTCRRIWKAHGFEEEEVTCKYSDYRRKHGYYAALSPYAITNEIEPILIRDADPARNAAEIERRLNQESEKRARNKLPENLDESVHFSQSTDIMPGGSYVPEDEPQSRSSSVHSIRTVWPTSGIGEADNLSQKEQAKTNLPSTELDEWEIIRPDTPTFLNPRSPLAAHHPRPDTAETTQLPLPLTQPSTPRLVLTHDHAVSTGLSNIRRAFSLKSHRRERDDNARCSHLKHHNTRMPTEE